MNEYEPEFSIAALEAEMLDLSPLIVDVLAVRSAPCYRNLNAVRKLSNINN